MNWKIRLLLSFVKWRCIFLHLFFYIMVYLVVHLVREIRFCGLVL